MAGEGADEGEIPDFLNQSRPCCANSGRRDRLAIARLKPRLMRPWLNWVLRTAFLPDAKMGDVLPVLVSVTGEVPAQVPFSSVPTAAPSIHDSAAFSA